MRKTIAISVVIHACLMLLLLLSPLFHSPFSKRSIRVRTITAVSEKKILAIETKQRPATPAKPPAPTAAAPLKPAPAATPNKPPAPIAAAPSQNNKPPKKSSAPTTPAALPKKRLAPKTPEIPTELLQDLERGIAKFTQKRDKGSPASLQASLQIDRIEPLSGSLEEKVAQLEYEERLIDFLHEMLHLPEVGEVKVKLLLREDGRIAKVVVLRAESAKNRSYLEDALPRLQCPRPENGAKTFVIAFCNEV